MLPLKTLPKILKHAAPAVSNDHRKRLLPNGSTALAAIRFNDTASGSGNGSQASSNSAASTISAMEAEETTLRERLIVLEEQRFMIEEMLSGARKRRKFDEVAALMNNLQDLNAEIDHINATLSRLDFAAVYNGGGGNGNGNGNGNGSLEDLR